MALSTKEAENTALRYAAEDPIYLKSQLSWLYGSIIDKPMSTKVSHMIVHVPLEAAQ